MENISFLLFALIVMFLPLLIILLGIKFIARIFAKELVKQLKKRKLI